VAVHGGLSIYTRSGAMQLVVDLVRPAGLGAATLELEHLRQRLAAEGLFDLQRKRQLPAWPRAIGVVTSAHGAAWHDIQTVVARRFPFVHLVLAPAMVQGPGAAEGIVAAIEAIQYDSRIDLVIVARGGGAADDLSAFNDERVARAVFASRPPVVTGIGHATDRTLVEDVADVAAPTPSAAAEMSVPSVAELHERVLSLASRLAWSMSAHHEAAAFYAERCSTRLRALSPVGRVEEKRAAIEVLRQRLERATRGRISDEAQRLANARAVLATLDPNAVLRRGYAALLDAADDEAIFSVQQIGHGRPVKVILNDGSLGATVDRVSPRREMMASAR
jgi:exodeoxyribonuclease VII large subunit